MFRIELTFINIFFVIISINAQWTQQNSGTRQNLISVDFVNQDKGWICGWGGTLLKTSNGGSDWISQNTGTSYMLNDVFFVNSLVGWIGGGWPDNFTTYSILSKTTDAGNSWIQQNSVGMISAIYFVNENIGWVVSNDFFSDWPYIRKTTNGGGNWSTQYSSLYSMILQDIFFVNQDTGWTAGGYTTDNGIILRTTNGGENWESQTNNYQVYRINSVFFVNELIGWAVGEVGKIYKTTDSGENWMEQDSGTDSFLYSVRFVNPDSGIIAGRTIILSTTNGGINWVEDSSYSNVYLNSLYMTDFSHAWICGQNGIILTNTSRVPVEIEFDRNIPDIFSLKQNYPNPFNSTTNLSFVIGHSSFVTLKVYDVLGNEVATLVNEEKPAGIYSAKFFGNNAASGIYYYKITAGSYTSVKKMMLLK